MIIKSSYGPPFDNPEWEERKEEIKDFLEKNSQFVSDGYGLKMIWDLYAALEAEESDNKMLVVHLATIYDEISGGLSDLLYEHFGGTLPS